MDCVGNQTLHISASWHVTKMFINVKTEFQLISDVCKAKYLAHHLFTKIVKPKLSNDL